MDLFDDTIVEIRNWFDDKQRSGHVSLWKIPEEKTRQPDGTEVLAEKKSSVGIILKEDTHVELGHPSAGSCCAALTTYDTGLVEDGQITLVGPDIPENREERLPFCQIIIAAIAKKPANDISSEATTILDKTASRLDRAAHIAAQGEGYMIRSVPNLIWARVSKDAALNGFSLRQLGEKLIWAVKQNCENISKCEIYFSTRNKADIETLDDIIEVARAKTRQLENFYLGPEGEYECTQEQDCGTCAEQVVCDNIRDVIKLRKGDRVISFGADEVTVRVKT